ncbi:MAG: hypothetical protein HOI66_09825 [Verrucomicrobia bacterium]|jgi:hypothetical protein|nr:hypothetical protein [Verrucomicrobiota bacterium]
MDNESDDQTYSVINVQEFIGKTVGRRKTRAPFADKSLGREAMIRSRELFGGVCVPRGVYRFKSHSEADQWMMQKIAQAAAAKG